MKSKLQNRKEEGFTIIEVLIVLAIAGLIMLIVFLAVPALQRNSRNTQTRDDASKALGALQESINNSNGIATVGTTAPAVVTGGQYSQITGFNYNVAPATGAGTGFQALTVAPAGGAAPNLNRETVYIRNFSVCAAGGNGQIGSTGGTSRQLTVTYLIESPGAATVNSVPAGFAAQCVSS